MSKWNPLHRFNKYYKTNIEKNLYFFPTDDFVYTVV